MASVKFESHRSVDGAAEYAQLVEDLNDARLAVLAAERMSAFDPKTLMSQEEVLQNLGMTEADLEGFDEVDIEP